MLLATAACSTGLLTNLAQVAPPPETAASPTSPATQPASANAVLPTPLPEELIAEADAEEQLLINVYQRVSPAVVNVNVSVDHETIGLTDFGSGSGFLIDTEGYVVTNRHVIQDADEVRVTLSDGLVLVAEVVGTDIYSDLAVLRITPPEDRPLVPVELGDSDNLLVGQRVIAIGNPFGLSGTMTVGIVSAVGRRLDSGQRSGGGSFSNPLIIQTDAAINPGNSGGPLLDSHGRVIGVNTAIRSTTGVNTGIGFAVPVNTVKRIVPQIIETGTVQYPYLGITSNPVVTLSDLSVEYDLPALQGVLVAEVIPGGSAARAGLRGGERIVNFRGVEVALGGDIITAIDGFAIRNFDELIGYLVSNTDVGQEVTVSILRDGETLDVPVVLDARPES